MAGRILIGYNHKTGAHYSAGIAGHGAAYVVVELVPGFAWVPQLTAGLASNIQKDRDYQIKLDLKGQRIQLRADNIKVIDGSLPHPLTGDAFGLFAWGRSRVSFRNVTIQPDEPKAFVVMQYGEPYDSLYREVIGPVCKGAGFNSFRVDDVYRPGIILQDIISGIVESEVIISEITPPNLKNPPPSRLCG
jgi:hypothetical protein